MIAELDDDDPLWLVNEQIKGLLEGDGADEDHQDVLAFFRKTGLPEDTVARIHKAVVCAEKGEPVAYRQMSSKFHCWDYADEASHLRKDNPTQALFLRAEANEKPDVYVEPQLFMDGTSKIISEALPVGTALRIVRMP